MPRAPAVSYAREGGAIASPSLRIVIPNENRTDNHQGGGLARPGCTGHCARLMWWHPGGWGGRFAGYQLLFGRLRRFCAACTGGRGWKSIVDHLANNWVGFGRVHLAAASCYAILNLAPPPRDGWTTPVVPAISFLFPLLCLPGASQTHIAHPDWSRRCLNASRPGWHFVA